MFPTRPMMIDDWAMQGIPMAIMVGAQTFPLRLSRLRRAKTPNIVPKAN